MDSPGPELFGLSKVKVARLARHAAEDAIRSHVRAGTPVTGLVYGRIASLDAGDPRLARFRESPEGGLQGRPANSA